MRIPSNVGSLAWRASLSVALAVSLSSLGAVPAQAAETLPFGEEQTYQTSDDVCGSLVKTYGVRAGSAGADFLGVTNTNFDFTSGSASSSAQYTDYADLEEYQLAGLAIWGSTVNESANPYYANLLYHAVTGKGSGYCEATTWMSNPSTGSWGDSNGEESTKAHAEEDEDATTIAGLEHEPEIVFGANKYTNWNLSSDGSNSGTNIYAYESADDSYNPVYVNNDATNIWTQVYTMGQLATAADDLKSVTSIDDEGNEVSVSTGKTTRYGSAANSALAYEKAIKGQVLYIASKIDSGTKKKTVAYLYAIDSTGTGYFFVPTAEGLVSDTAEAAGTGTGGAATNTAATANQSYAANNSTIDMGYMGTLPLVTNTFDSGAALEGGIVMKVEDIYSENPVCTVGSDSSETVMADVDVIIYNSTVNTSLDGTSGGKNSSGIDNDYNGDALSASEVAAWAGQYGFAGAVIAGDDFGTSTNQGYGTVDATEDGMAPLLYCQRNYTADKNARAAWAFAQVYPDLYGGNEDATYAYWVDEVYHVKTDMVGTVAAYMTNQSGEVAYDEAVAAMVEANAEAGYEWWQETGSKSSKWGEYAYYSGSSRASYYSEDDEAGVAAEESDNTIGILVPSELWAEAEGDL